MAGEGAGKPPACTWGVSFPCGMTKRGPAIPPLLSLYLDPPAGSVLRRNEGENQMTKPLAELLTQIDGGGPIDRGAIREHLARYDQLLDALRTMTDLGKEVARSLKRLADDAQHETVICVRYLALIDETNRRLSATFYREPGRAQLS